MQAEFERHAKCVPNKREQLLSRRIDVPIDESTWKRGGGGDTCFHIGEHLETVIASDRIARSSRFDIFSETLPAIQ